MTTLADLYDKLEHHDWWYAYADQGSVYDRGRKQRLEIEHIAKESPEHHALFYAYAKHVFKSRPKPPAPAISDLTEGSPT